MKSFGLLLFLFTLQSCSNLSSFHYAHQNKYQRTPASQSHLNCHQAIRKLSSQRRLQVEKKIGDSYLLNKYKVKITDYIGEGSIGEVYKVEVLDGSDDLMNKDLVLKLEKIDPNRPLQLGDTDVTNISQFMGLKELEKIDFPAVRIIDASFDYSALLIEQVKGYTLREYTKVFRIDEKFIFSLVKLQELIEQIKQRELYIHDLHDDNIMFDIQKKKWLVVDLGQIESSQDPYIEFFDNLHKDKRVIESLKLIREIKNSDPHLSPQEITDEFMKKANETDLLRE